MSRGAGWSGTQAAPALGLAALPSLVGFVILVYTFVVLPPKVGWDFSKYAVTLNKERYYCLLQGAEIRFIYSSKGLAGNPDNQLGQQIPM